MNYSLTIYAHNVLQFQCWVPLSEGYKNFLSLNEMVTLLIALDCTICN